MVTWFAGAGNDGMVPLAVPGQGLFVKVWSAFGLEQEYANEPSRDRLAPHAGPPTLPRASAPRHICVKLLQ